MVSESNLLDLATCINHYSIILKDLRLLYTGVFPITESAYVRKHHSILLVI